MPKMIIVPDGWECELKECPPGFFVYEKQLCFKTEYKKEDGVEDDVYNSAGETFCAENPIVQPVTFEWVEDERL